MKTLPFEGGNTGIIRNIESQDNSQGVYIENRLAVDIRRMQAKARDEDVAMVFVKLLSFISFLLGKFPVIWV